MTPWTHLPAAAALLASCKARPPKVITHRHIYGANADNWHEYDRRDSRVAELHEIADAFFESVIMPASRDLAAHSRDELLDAYPSVTDAIDAATRGAADAAREDRAAA